jgi:D-ribulokinase
MSRLGLGIDVGTSGIRAAVMAPSGEILGMAATRFAEIASGPATPEIWATALERTLARLAEATAFDGVTDVAVDGTSGTMLAIDAEGHPVGPARMYDEPCQEEGILARIAACAPAGSPAKGRTSALARVIMMQGRAGAVQVVHQADWIAGLLCGAFGESDENNALKTGYDPVTRAWPDWLADAGVDPGKLPRVRQPGAAVRPLGGAGVRFGLPAAAVLRAGTTDGCAAFIATGAREVGDGVTSLGSTLVLKLLSAVPITSEADGIYSHRLGDLWLPGGASNTGGRVIEALFPGEDLAALSAAIDPERPTGLDYYPLPGPGERFPVNDPALSPRLEPRPAEPALFFQGVLEGIAAIEGLAYRRLEELGAPRLRSVRTVGGGAANHAWERIRQRRLGVPFLPAFSQEACIGAARLALGLHLHD